MLPLRIQTLTKSIQNLHIFSTPPLQHPIQISSIRFHSVQNSKSLPKAQDSSLDDGDEIVLLPGMNSSRVRSRYFSADPSFASKFDEPNPEFQMPETSTKRIVNAVTVASIIGFVTGWFCGYFRDYEPPTHPFWWFCTLFPIPWSLGAVNQRNVPLRYVAGAFPAILLGQYLGSQYLRKNPYYWQQQLELHLQKVFPDTYVPPKRKHWLDEMMVPPKPQK